MPYADPIELTLAENWLWTLRDVSLAGECLVLDQANTLAFASAWSPIRQAMGIQDVLAFSDDVEQWLDDNIQRYDGGAFIRTGFGMPKECPFAYAPVRSTQEAIGVLRWPDSRLGKYALARVQNDDPVSIVVRPWVDMDRGREFRVFVEDNRFRGACPLYPEAHRRIDEADALSALKTLVAAVNESAPLSSYVADAVLLQSGVARLIELNPFIPSTDSILFSWTGDDMDGRFRLSQPAA